MQEAAETSARREKPRWRRIVDHPLVTMVLAALLYIVAVSVGLALRAVPLPMGPNAKAVFHTIVEVAIVLLAYKLVIVRMGERPGDDLPARNSLRDLGLGLLAGLIIFS